MLTFDENGDLAPGCAEKWETSDDGLKWTFHLRDGLKWSDGSPLSAKDFVYSWKRVADPKTGSAYAETFLFPVKGFDEAINGNVDALCVSAPDDLTFVVELSSPCTYFESLVTFVTLSPVQEKTIKENGDTWSSSTDTLISNGPFYISEWEPDSYIIISKNPNYWNADKIKLGSIKWVLGDNGYDSYNAYKNGDILFTKVLPSSEVSSLSANDDFYVDPIIGTYYITLNTKSAPFNNPLVRKALSLAIDREYVAKTIMEGTCTPATNLVGPGWKDPTGGDFITKANNGKTYISDDYEKNLEEAKALMKQAGYKADPENPDILITYTTNDNGYHVDLELYLRQAWKELGVDLKGKIVEWDEFFPSHFDGNFELCRGGWIGDYPDPSSLLDLMYTNSGLNDANYSSPDFDATIDTARSASNPTARSNALHKAEDIIMQEAPIIPVVYYGDIWLQSEKIQGMWHTATGYFNFIYADITK